MHGFKRLALLAIFAVLAGILAALFTPKAEAIWANYTIKNLPGPPSDTGVLTCGWHSGACPGSGMVALDWQGSGGATVYWRSWLYHQYASPNTVVAKGYSTQYNTSLCYRTRVRVASTQSGQFMGYVYYTHTQSNGATRNILGSSSWSYTKASVATVRSSEMQYCPWDGPNIHQADDAGQWTENGAYPTSSQCTLCYWSYNVASSGNWQFSLSSRVQY